MHGKLLYGGRWKIGGKIGWGMSFKFYAAEEGGVHV